MNKNGLYLGFVLSGILAVIVYASYGMMNLDRAVTYYSVSVIVEDSSNDRWNALKEGLEQAASEHHIYLNMVSTGEISDYNEEYTILARELENGADGIIMEMCDSADADSGLTALTGDTAVVLMDTRMDIPQDNAFTVVSTDAAAVGEAIAKAVAEGEKTDNYTIGILAGNQKKSSMQLQLQGFCDTIAETDARIVWTLTENDLAGGASLAEMMSQTETDVIVAMENDEMERAVDFLLENPEYTCRLYGEGRSEKAVYYLGKGVIEAMIVADEYSVGYQCVAQIAAQLEQADTTIRSIEAGFVSVTREEMYDEDTARILFPVI